MSVRQQQIESTLRRVISQVLTRRLADPRIAGMISVTRVTVSPDLYEAYVYVSVLPQALEVRCLAGLRHATRHIHTEVSELVAMKKVPRLDFRLDETLKKQAEVFDAIRRGLSTTGNQPPAADGEAPDPPPADDGLPAAPQARRDRPRSRRRDNVREDTPQ